MDNRNLTNKEVVELFFVAGYNEEDYDTVRSCLAPNYDDHGAADASSADEAVEILKSTHEAFPDIEVSTNDLIEEGELVAFRGHFSGTHQGEFIGIPASGARVRFEALEIFKVIDGKITESWGYWPNSEIVEQIRGDK